jgi:hypothetical protein
MTIAQIAVLLLPALLGGVSAVVLFQLADRIREYRAMKSLHKPAHQAATA